MNNFNNSSTDEMTNVNNQQAGINQPLRRIYTKVSPLEAERFVRFYNENNVSIKDAAARYDISYQNAKKIILKNKNDINQEDNSGIELRRRPGRTSIITNDLVNYVEILIEENASYTLE